MRGHYAKRNSHLTNQRSDRGIAFLLRSFNGPDLIDQNVPFDNTNSDLSYKSALEIRVRITARLKVAVFSHFRGK